MNLHRWLHLPQHRLCRGDRQRRPVAIAAQVQLHQMLQPPWLRAPQYFPHQLRRLHVRQMPLVAEHARDQPGRATAGPLQHFVVIELQGQHIRIGHGLRQFRVPAAEVRGIHQHARLPEHIGRALKAEAASHTAVMPQSQRPAAQRRGQRQLLPHNIIMKLSWRARRSGNAGQYVCRMAWCSGWQYSGILCFRR